MNEYLPISYYPHFQYYQLWTYTTPPSPKHSSSQQRSTIPRKRKLFQLQCNQRNTSLMSTRDYDRKTGCAIIISNDSQRKKSCRSFKMNSFPKYLKISSTKDSMDSSNQMTWIVYEYYIVFYPLSKNSKSCDPHGRTTSGYSPHILY